MSTFFFRASVGSTEAAKDVVARFGLIDRSCVGSIDFCGSDRSAQKDCQLEVTGAGTGAPEV
jgi:hypothetical protein